MWFDGQAARLARSSGFRLVWRSLALSLAGAAMVFAIIHHAVETGWRDEIDATVAGALQDIQFDLRRDGRPLAENVRDTLAENGGLFYADIGPGGTVLAGNLQLSRAMAPQWAGFRTLQAGDGFILPRRVTALRGVVQEFPGGERLVIAADASGLLALKRLIAQSFLAVFGTILAFGLLGGSLAARTALRRVDDFAATIEDIMQGDLSRRLTPGRGGDEFDRLAARLNEMLQRIQELMENLRQVTNDIAHDLRSPLARLREHLELAQRRFEGAEAGAVLDEALAQTDQALEIFAAMLQIAEIEAGARRARFAPVALTALLEMLAESYEPSFAEQGIGLESRIETGLSMAGDKELLSQLVTNLLDNIILHGRGAGRAAICARRAGANVELVVADDGCGIPAEQRGRVIQRFVRLDASRHLPGHGLGLALVFAIAALHGAEVELGDNAPGLRVRISLPGAAPLTPP